MKTLFEHFSTKRKRNEILSRRDSSITAQVSYGTPKSTLSLTPQTPPSPIYTKDDGLTPPSPHSSPASSNRVKIHHDQSEIRTPPSPILCSPQSKRIKVVTTSRRIQDSKQLYLDFGQSSFGKRTICPVCNMLYVNGMKEDEENHRKICSDYSLGVAFNMWKQARVVFEKTSLRGGSTVKDFSLGRAFLVGKDTSTSKDRIVEVRESDSIQLRRKVLKVKDIVDQELGFCNNTLSKNDSETANCVKTLNSTVFGDHPTNAITSNSFFGGKTVYIYIQNKRVIGFCSVEALSKAYHLSPDEVASDHSISSRSTNPSRAMMGVHQLWCHRSHRKEKIATMLIDTARSKFVYGCIVPIKMTAFSSPTSDGTRFARKYGNTISPLIYDCR